TESRLAQDGRTLVASSDFNLNAQAGSWQLGLFANFIYNRSRTATDNVVFAAPRPVPRVVRATVESIGGQVNALGPLLALPAGPLTLRLQAGASHDSIEG